MKKSKKFITRSLLSIAKRFSFSGLNKLILFLHCYTSFKKRINRKKNNLLFSNDLDEINNFEFQITSQNNEDGIIEHIFSKIPNKKTFVEIGLTYNEFNTLNLIKNGWEGALIEIQKDECVVVQSLIKHFYPKSTVEIVNASINKKNINEIVFGTNNDKKIDFFSIDIDGNDYWVLKNMNLKNVKVVCCEYNHWLGKDKKKVMPYNEKHVWSNNGYWGASLLALDDLMASKGFCLITVESSGTNAFYVQKNYSKFFQILSPKKSWRSVGRFDDEESASRIRENVLKSSFLEINN